MSEAWDPQLRLLCALLPFQAQVAWKRQVGGSIEASPSTLKSYLCPIGSTHGARDRSRVGVSAHNPAPHSSPHPHRSTGLGLLCGHFACCPATEDPDEPQTLKPLNPAKQEPLRGPWNPAGCSRHLCCCLNMIHLLLHCIYFL